MSAFLKTLLEISFELSIDPHNIPGIPYLIAKSLVKKIEPIISKEVAKNLEKTAQQVEVELFIQKNELMIAKTIAETDGPN